MAASGDRLRILAGPYRGFVGRVEALDADRARVRVAVLIFGRSTTLQLELCDVERG